jgi:glucose-6-phosphate isomerase
VVEAAFAAAGIDAARRVVAITDPGSPLHELAEAAGYRALFLADPTVGGRFSALTAFGLVPSGLAGADVARLLDDAEAVADLLTEDADGNPALVLAAALAGTEPLRDKVVLTDAGSSTPGIARWVEHLLAESTGKDESGLLPVWVEGTNAPEIADPPDDVLVVRLGPRPDEAPSPLLTDSELLADADAPGEDWRDDVLHGDDRDVLAPPLPDPGPGDDVHEVTVTGPLGAQFLLWEFATAIAGRMLALNPFDEPDVEGARRDAGVLARGAEPATADPEPPALVDGAIEIRATPGVLGSARDLPDAVDGLLDHLGERGYLAVTAYLDAERDAPLADVRPALAARTHRPVTFGWGHRVLHSTGQFHQAGTPVGVYLQITGAADDDLAVPGYDLSFGQLLAGQAAREARALAARGRPVLRVHLTDRQAGLRQLAAVLGDLELTA